ncbi:MAG: LytTR family DNA-binding domain-containing protein, partial [Vicingaceae bacterium]|nr:LytTR family DNA-binding domain-containing protein [Vicingaceae bacterium]
ENINLVGEFADGFSGLKAINELRPDIVFLDVQMPKLTGLELLELVEGNPHIIFTTAYDEYAINAFDLNAVDYLLKPFSKERFDKALDKVFGKIEGNNVSQLKTHISESNEIDKIVVKSNNNIHVISLVELLYIESENDYVMIHTSKGKYLKHQTMKFYEERLKTSEFVRIHRSYIVKITEIKKIEKYGKDSYQVILKNGIDLKVSRSRYQELKTTLGI